LGFRLGLWIGFWLGGALMKLGIFPLTKNKNIDFQKISEIFDDVAKNGQNNASKINDEIKTTFVYALHVSFGMIYF